MRFPSGLQFYDFLNDELPNVLSPEKVQMKNLNNLQLFTILRKLFNSFQMNELLKNTICH